MPTLAERLEILERRVAQLETERDRYRQAAEIMANEKVGGTFPAVVELTWLNRVGAVVVVAGLVLAAAWANDRGYLSPPLRNGLLLAGGAGLGTGSRRSGHSGCTWCRSRRRSSTR
jgi:hypothetical protein